LSTNSYTVKQNTEGEYELPDKYFQRMIEQVKEEERKFVRLIQENVGNKTNS